MTEPKQWKEGNEHFWSNGDSTIVKFFRDGKARYIAWPNATAAPGKRTIIGPFDTSKDAMAEIKAWRAKHAEQCA